MTNILLNENNRHRKYTGIDKFHSAGYFGGRVTAASGENWSLSSYNPDGLCFDPLKLGCGGDSHATDTAATFFQVAPKTKLYMLPSTTGSYGGNGIDYTNKFLEESVKIIEDKNITNMFVSLNGSRHKKYFEDLSKWLQDHDNFKYFYAAGNDSNSKYNQMLEIEEIIGVAAYTLMVSGEVLPASYSSVTKYVDFSAPSYIYVNINAAKPTDNGSPSNGTSFSTPWLCGMACLVDDFFIDKTGKPLTRDMMIQFFKDHTIDIGDKGFDNKTGFGAVVLPDPSEIDINKYRSGTMLEKFTDANKVSIWAKDSVEYCLVNGYLNGKSENIFDPLSNLTREEMCCIIERVVNKLKEGK